MTDALEQYIESRIAAANKRYATHHESIEGRSDLTAEEKEAHKGALWETINARIDELKRVRKFLRTSD